MKHYLSSLSYKVIAWALAFSVVFTLVMTSVLVFMHYSTEQEYVREQLKLAADQSGKNLAASLWDLDIPAVRLQLDALARFPGVGHAVLTTAIGQRFVAHRGGESLPAPGDKIASLALTLDSPAPPARPVGTLLLIADEKAMLDRISREALRIVFGEAIKGFLLALLLAVLVTRLVTRHVEHIARQAAAITPSALETPIVLERDPSHYPDELDQLCDAFNSRNRDLADYIRRQQSLEEELRSHRDNLSRLVEERTSSLLQTQQALRRANQELYELSRHDSLTGLANRRHFDEAKAVEFRRAMRAGAPLSVLMCDLDDFKAFNDTYGHAQGDEALKALGTCLRQLFSRAGELPARLGGEEFAVLLPNTTAEQATVLAERLRHAVEEMAIEHRLSRTGQNMTVSIGVSSLKPTRHHSFDQLLQEADEALYRSKQAGRNQITAL